jgi:hypothetical protein
VLENKTEKADKNDGERPVNDDKDLVYLHVGNSDDRVGYRLSQNHTADAAEVVLLVEIAPQLVVGPKKQKAREARKNSEHAVREEFGPADAVGKKRQREIDKKAGNNNDKGIGNRKQALAQPEVSK